jgi:hypothetical protein
VPFAGSLNEKRCVAVSGLIPFVNRRHGDNGRFGTIRNYNYAPDVEKKEIRMLFILFYIVAITVVVLHYTGFLRQHNLEWLVFVLAVAVLPAVIYL